MTRKRKKKPAAKSAEETANEILSVGRAVQLLYEKVGRGRSEIQFIMNIVGFNCAELTKSEWLKLADKIEPVMQQDLQLLQSSMKPNAYEAASKQSKN